MSEAAAPKRRTFKKFSFRGVDLEDLLKAPLDDFTSLLHARARRRFLRNGRTSKKSKKVKPAITGKHERLLKKLLTAKANTGPNEKPAIVKTHLRNMIVIPEMIGSVVGVYNGKVFNQVEIKPEMVGHYLGEFSITYTPVSHKRPGAGSATASRFIPLK